MLPKKSAYVKSHNGETKSMFFSIGAEQLLKKLGKNSSKNKVTNSMKKKLYCEPTSNKKFLKTKMKNSGKSTDFHDRKILKVGSNILV